MTVLGLGAAQWSSREVRVGEAVAVSCRAFGYEEGTAAKVLVYRREGGTDAVVAEIATEVSGGRVEAEWTCEHASAAGGSAASSGGDIASSGGPPHFVAKVHVHPAGAPATAVTGALSFIGTVRAQVVREEDGRKVLPVGGARCRLFTSAGEVREAEADADGQVVFEDVPAGSGHTLAAARPAKKQRNARRGRGRNGGQSRGGAEEASATVRVAEYGRGAVGASGVDQLTRVILSEPWAEVRLQATETAYDGPDTFILRDVRSDGEEAGAQKEQARFWAEMEAAQAERVDDETWRLPFSEVMNEGGEAGDDEGVLRTTAFELAHRPGGKAKGERTVFTGRSYEDLFNTDGSGALRVAARFGPGRFFRSEQGVLPGETRPPTKRDASDGKVDSKEMSGGATPNAGNATAEEKEDARHQPPARGPAPQ